MNVCEAPWSCSWCVVNVIQELNKEAGARDRGD